AAAAGAWKVSSVRTPPCTWTWEGSQQPPGSPPGWPLYAPHAAVLRDEPPKSSERTAFQPGRSPVGIAWPDGPPPATPAETPVGIPRAVAAAPKAATAPLAAARA